MYDDNLEDIFKLKLTDDDFADIFDELNKEERKKASAIKIQSLARGRSVRKKASIKKKAATKIQALSRSFLVRRKMKMKEADINKMICNNSNLYINRKNQQILNNILFTKRDLSFVKKVGSKITIKIPNSSDNFHFEIDEKRKLGSGTYSQVYELYDVNHQVKIALKKEDNVFPSEAEISRILWESKCNTINEVYFKSEKDYHYYFMSLAHGGTLADLKKRTKNLDLDEKKKMNKLIVETVRKQLVCLFKNGYMYSDFKLQNILVDCDNIMKIYLGDLGSAIPNVKGRYAATYPPRDLHMIEPGIFEVSDREKEGVVSWGLGILLFFMMPSSINDSNHFLYSKDYDKQKHNESIKEMDDFYGKGFGNYLKLNAKDRPSIYDKIDK